MAVKRLLQIRPQLDDGSGVLASNYRLFFYAAGSSTKQNTYNSSTGGVANSNPIVLNARGEIAGEVWGTVGQTYKIGLAIPGSDDPPATFVWSEDNVACINDATGVIDQWVSGPAPTFIGATSFSLVGDQTTTMTVGRRLKTTNSGGTIYSIITASAFTTLTTITVANDSGSLDSGLSAMSYGLLSADNSSVPHTKFSTTQFGIQDAFALAGTITPSQITSNQNDYNPSGLASVSVLNLTTDASRDVTGLQGGAAGRIILVRNVGSFPIVLKNESGSSSAANRFTLDGDLTLSQWQAVELQYDAAVSRWRSYRASNGEYRSMQVFTAGGTWTKPTGLKRVEVTVVGAGGAGGGSANTGAGQVSAGAGGGGGGTSIKTISAATLGATETVTVGAGGTGTAGATGATGGTTSFGAHASATGGVGGVSAGAAAGTQASGGAGGVGSSGDINISGGGGTACQAAFGNGAAGGTGGSSTMGGGGAGKSISTGTTVGGNYGGGGSGDSINQSSTGNAGGAGAGGIVIVKEYF